VANGGHLGIMGHYPGNPPTIGDNWDDLDIIDSDLYMLYILKCIEENNFKLNLKNLETKATLKMNVEGLEKLIFTNIHFNMKVELEKDDEWERKKAKIFQMTKKICPIRQSWGEKVSITFELNFQ